LYALATKEGHGEVPEIIEVVTEHLQTPKDPTVEIGRLRVFAHEVVGLHALFCSNASKSIHRKIHI